MEAEICTPKGGCQLGKVDYFGRVTPSLNQLLHAASRTFAVGIDLMPEPLRAEVEVAYLLLRVSDYLEDNASMEAAQKVRLLELWARALEDPSALGSFETALGPVEDESPDALVARNVARVHRALTALERAEARALIERHVRDSTLGMARWAARGPAIADEADLDDYMHEVAGRVGLLLTELFALDIPSVASRREEMLRLGREFGLGLQTVNVIRGLHADWRRGWIYVPRSFLGQDDVEPAAIFEGGAASRASERAVLDRLVQKAARHLEAAGRYIERLPRRPHGVRLFCVLPYLFALRTLSLSQGDTRVFRGEVKIRRSDVERITRAARLFGWSNGWIRWYARRLGPSDQPAEQAMGGRRPLKLATD
jgi:farnesyl-diphosphate farnesyltransferase